MYKLNKLRNAKAMNHNELLPAERREERGERERERERHAEGSRGIHAEQNHRHNLSQHVRLTCSGDCLMQLSDIILPCVHKVFHIPLP